jgi:hypothetical protein
MNEQPNPRHSTAEMARQAANDPHQEGHLSTADMAAAAGRPARPAEMAPNAPSQAAHERATPLFPSDQAQQLRSRWESVQAGFVDEPRRSVEQADGLVAEVIKSLAETFASERSNLEQQWGRGNNISTEDLRLALQRYRSFFDRLLSV